MKFVLLFLGLLAAALAMEPPKPNGLARPLQGRRVPIKFSEEQIKKYMILLEKSETRAGTTAIINDYADQIFANIQDWMIHAGIDPFEMPEIHEGFSYTIIITFHGELDMTNGWLQDVSTIHRGGDVVVSYDTDINKLTLTLPITFNDLQFTYDYKAQIMDLGPSGGVEGKITNLAVGVTLSFDFNTYQASLDEFYILNSGHIDLNFSGNVLIDWLLNLLVDVASAALHSVILLIMEAIVRSPLESLVNFVNELLNTVLNPPAPTDAPSRLLFNY